MSSQRWSRLSRRDVLKLMGVSGAMVAAGLPAHVLAQTRKGTLVIAIDISDTITLDPARLAQYTSPMSVEAAYDTLVTMTPGEYVNVEPALATKWARTADGSGWRFTIRDGVKFASGTPMTVEDVKWSFDRVHQPEGSAVAIRGSHRPGGDRRQADDRHHPEEAGAAASFDHRGTGIRRHGPQAGRAAWRHGRRQRQGRRQGDDLAQRQFGRNRRLRHDAMGAQRADTAGAQPALLAGQDAVRARRDPPHERQRGAAAGGAPRRRRHRVQPDPRADRHPERRQGRPASIRSPASTSSTWR